MIEIQNVTFDALAEGQEATFERTCTERDLFLFAHVSGNLNPRTLPDRGGECDGAVAPATWLASLISSLLGNRLPGPGTF
ncbi:MAG: hypothetical protein NZM40_05415 [Sphingomonadaceae bacterium]|uniref:hypothetical protein n=1 Tax=Thermaurantiacus sp. TaxID=2820283 RepID=UPI00298F2C0F|nr:hypothetical protein [Thermaurantiacus sp.]MCS6986857.1 hypothetical protein [Sphingomonadaceae bacterium]MDW8415543.1 hypothetical protein [Thermaurantiacus sp.]